MAHLRNRHIAPSLQEQGKFWPVVGLLGLRQSGKSTIFRDLQKAGAYVTFDDSDAYEDATNSSKNFLLKLPRPLIIDEVQKVPGIFDSMKLLVDQKRHPGTFFITGSSQFSAKIGVRESLTGRIGINYLYPMTLAEAHQQPFQHKRATSDHTLPLRHKIEDALKQFLSGGLPVPLFTRSEAAIQNYFQNWLDTSLFRDAQRAFGKGYNPDIALNVIEQLTAALREGEYPTLKHFKLPSRKLRQYLQAFEDIFLLQRIAPHSATIGSDVWTFADTGILAYCNKGVIGEGVQLSLARIFTIKEIRATCEYAQKRLRLQYFKTARSSIVDLIWNDVPVKISSLPSSRIDYDLRPLRAAMKHLESKKGILLWGRDNVEKDSGVSIKPWTIYS